MLNVLLDVIGIFDIHLRNYYVLLVRRMNKKGHSKKAKKNNISLLSHKPLVMMELRHLHDANNSLKSQRNLRIFFNLNNLR